MYVKQDKTVPVDMTAIEKICNRLRSSDIDNRAGYFYILENACLEHYEKRVCFAEGPVRFCRSSFPQVHPYRLSPMEEILIARYHSVEDVGGEDRFIDQIATLVVLLSCPHEFVCTIPIWQEGYEVGSFWEEHEGSSPIFYMIRDALSGMVAVK